MNDNLPLFLKDKKQQTAYIPLSLAKMFRHSMIFKSCLVLLSLLAFVSLLSVSAEEDKVVVDIISANDAGAPVTKDYKYRSMVTLYIEDTVNKSKTPSGWSTRVSDGATKDQPFDFQPGIGLIQGWTEGVLQMKEGERAWLHVPSSKGYGKRPMGSPGGAFYIPANSDLLFDIEILGKVESEL
mmetsp:Transcript_93420/g.140179  ORF Transcript_93420/g.140179 Transcript_93420/m.140179 type:complete len:183 (-) Transcript_93420:100-648(-)